MAMALIGWRFFVATNYAKHQKIGNPAVSSDNDNKRFLPQSAIQWLGFLSTIGLPVGATWGLVVHFWKSAEGEVSVNTQLGLVTAATTVSGLAVLWWYAYRRQKRLKAFEDRTPKVPKLSFEEEKVLKFFAVHDGEQLPVYTISNHLQLPPIRFHYHWHRLHDEARYVEHVGNSCYMLSHAGRKYVVEKKLIAGF